MLPYDGYFVFYCTPKFNITTAVEQVNDHIVQSINSLFVEDDLVITQEELAKITKNIDLSMKGNGTIKDTLNEAVNQVNYQKEKEYMSQSFNPKLIPDDYGLDQPFSRGSSQMLYIAE
jgi:hypothetical protein